MDAEALKTLLDESQDQIIKDVRAKIVERVSSNYEWEIAKLVNEQVKDFFAAEVAPEIVKGLMGEKGAIVQAATAAAANVAVKLAEKMTETAIKNIDGYTFRNLTKELFS
jgi:hypothetical protein